MSPDIQGRQIIERRQRIQKIMKRQNIERRQRKQQRQKRDKSFITLQAFSVSIGCGK